MANITTLKPKKSERRLSDVESAFMTYESELDDLLRGVLLVALAYENHDDYGGINLTGIALDHLRDQATKLKAKWYEDHKRVFSAEARA